MTNDTEKVIEPIPMRLTCEGRVIEWRLIEARNPDPQVIGPKTDDFVTIVCMPESHLPAHVAGLVAYLSQSQEKANEDRAINYFRHVYADDFKRQNDAKNADGYVPGSFVLELKGSAGDWHAGLLQGLAYGRHLDFSAVVVIAKGFLAIWRVDAFPTEILETVRSEPGAANQVGKRLAQKYAAKKKDHLGLALWTFPAELLATLFADERKDRAEDQRIRLKITPSNFTDVLRGMVPFFETPLKAVRAFYSIIFNWEHGSSVIVSERHMDQAALGGELIESLLPTKRYAFKEYVERYAVDLAPGEALDDFFAHFDEALDTVAPAFRRKHGIFFTDLALSKFVMWLIKRELGDIGQNHLVIDPACGSGNLVTNWCSPLELRHKVVSEIEPELLFAVERRMRGDAWHNGRFTVIPKVSEGKGLNFLEPDAASYVRTLQEHLKEKGLDANKPIAFLCNPPYRNDDDRTIVSSPVDYTVHPSIIEMIGLDAAKERYCCFLAQMKLVLGAAQDSGLPGDSLMLVFTKLGWLTGREVLGSVRQKMLCDFENVGGVLVDGTEFFDVKGKFPVAFTMWRYKPNHGDEARQITTLTDLTWVKHGGLASLPWDDVAALEGACKAILDDPRSIKVSFGAPRLNIREWTGLARANFYRSRRKAEITATGHVGGLPANDRRLTNKQTYGEANGASVGFMDDRTPCRIPNTVSGVPWFRLDAPFMDCRKSRCFSGKPDQKGYYPDTQSPESADQVFLWYAIQKVFVDHGYPMWADPLELWAPVVSPQLELAVRKLSRAIAFADNECVETRFPANNPVHGAPELFVVNPLSPNAPASYWVKHMAEFFGEDDNVADRLVAAVLAIYKDWQKLFRVHAELPMDSEQPYYIGGNGFVTASSGLMQIREYVEWQDLGALRTQLQSVQSLLKETKTELHRLLISKDAVDYFGSTSIEKEVAE